MTTPLTCESLKLRHARLAWLQETAHKERDAFILEAKGADARLARAPKLQAHLESMQSQTHAQTVGAYESILTELVHEVMGPGRDVKLTTGYRNNQPALDIDVMQGEFTEDILEGNGGALTNVVCAGLRFTAVARSGKRRFLVLDEPDCWTKPERVPAFFKALASVCEQAGFQALVVSHHPMDPRDPNCLEGAEDMPASVSYVRLRTDKSGKVVADCELSGEVTEGIEGFRAQDFRTHLDTQAKIGPAMTLLTGDNNLGKSALMAGLRALARGGASDAHIRHKTDELLFELSLLKEGVRHSVSLQRKRKGSPRVTLTHRIEGQAEPEHEERGSQHSVPDWLSELLDLDTIEGLDPQLLGQKTPVFLLDQSATVRAKLLYAGREAAILAKMFSLHRKQVAEDRERMTRLGVLIANRTQQVDATVGLDVIGAAITSLSGRREVLTASEMKQRSLEAVLPRLARATAQARMTVPPITLTPPLLHDCVGLHKMARQLSRVQSFVAQYREVVLPEAPLLKDTRGLQRAGVQIRRLSVVAQLPPPPALPVAPELHQSGRLANAMTQLVRATQRITALEAEQLQITRQIEIEHAVLESLIAEVGGTCPLCHSALTQENLTQESVAHDAVY